MARTSKRIKKLAEAVNTGTRGDAFKEFRAAAEANGYKAHRGGWITDSEGTKVARGWVAFAYEVAYTGDIVLTEPESANILTPESGSGAATCSAHGPLCPHPSKCQPAPPTVDVAETMPTYEGDPAPVAEESFPIRQCRTAPAAQARPSRWARTLLNIQEGQAVTASLSPVFHADHTIPAGSHTEITYFYTTRTPTIPITEVTSVQVTLTETATTRTEGPCVSGAALDCAGEGILRVLPESMLPNNAPEKVMQCLPCYEASAAAYVRKLHGGE